MEHKDLIEALDACRPGSDDLASPEMKDVAEALEADSGLRDMLARSQAFDQSVTQAMEDIPVPPGLQDQLLLQASPRAPVITRRRWIAALATTAASLGVIGGLWRYLGSHPRQMVNSVDYAHAVLGWIRAEFVSSSLKVSMPPDGLRPYFSSRAIRGWQEIPAELGGGVAYAPAGADSSVNAWMITRRLESWEQTETGLPGVLPKVSPTSLSGNFASYGLGACRQGDLLYLVLVDPKDFYSDFCRTETG